MAAAGAEPLVQLRKQGKLAGEAAPGRKLHFCVACECPIAVYGRLRPCLHAFCQQCAAGMASCFVCDGSIASIEVLRHGAQDVYISAATLQSYLSALGPLHSAITAHVCHMGGHTSCECAVLPCQGGLRRAAAARAVHASATACASQCSAAHATPCPTPARATVAGAPPLQRHCRR